MQDPTSPQIEYVADGAIGKIASILGDLQPRSLFLVADPVAYGNSGAEAALESVLAPFAVRQFTEFHCDPKLPDVRRGIDRFRQDDVDAVLAVGGGSALDVAKLVSNLGVQQESAEQLVRGTAQLQRDGPPLIAVPTTAGTGSEATHFAVCYIDGEKYSLADPFLLPEYAIVDPQLTHSLPPRLTAASGLDALCQAVESLWAVGSNDESVRPATAAARLAIEHLAAAVNAPTPADRAAMSRAAHLAGQAINISKTTAPHAISYAITTQAGVPHGLAVALTLIPILMYNAETTAADCTDPRCDDHVRSRVRTVTQLFGCATPGEAAAGIETLIRSVGGHTRLSEVDLHRDTDIQMLVDRVNTQRLSNNPRRITPEVLRELLEGIR